jgi:hypothetical protein
MAHAEERRKARERARSERARLAPRTANRFREQLPDSTDPMEHLEGRLMEHLRALEGDIEEIDDPRARSAARTGFIKLSRTFGRLRVDANFAAEPWKGLPPPSLAGLTAEQLAALADGRVVLDLGIIEEDVTDPPIPGFEESDGGRRGDAPDAPAESNPDTRED